MGQICVILYNQSFHDDDDDDNLNDDDHDDVDDDNDDDYDGHDDDDTLKLFLQAQHQSSLVVGHKGNKLASL